MKQRIWIKRMDRIKQRYWIGKNIGRFIEIEKKGRTIKTRRPEELIRISQDLEKGLKPLSDKLSIAGGIRRRSKKISDIDFVVIPKDKKKIQQFLSKKGKIKSSGDKRISAIINDVKTDIFFTEPKSWGATLLYATGPLGSSISRRQRAKDRKLKLNQYGLYDGNKLIAGKTEKGIYNALGLTYRPPELRGLPR